jgi:small subunit ribosomal protein S20
MAPRYADPDANMRCLASFGPVGAALDDRTRQGHKSTVANIKSQIKRNKTNIKAHERNKAVKSSLRTASRRVREALAAGEVDRAQELAREAGRKLDKAVSKGVIHKNQAANKKSALDKAVAQATSA